MKWLVADSLSCPEQFFCSHLDATSHYLRESGEEADTVCLNLASVPGVTYCEGDAFRQYDVLFALDRYDQVAAWSVFAEGRNVLRRRPRLIAQVAALCNPMPWDVRKPDGSPAYDLVISSLRWMVEAAKAAGCRAAWMPLAFDHRALTCGMKVKERDIPCLFVGSIGGNHKRRTDVLRELSDLVTVAPPTFGRSYFELLFRARSVLNIHAEWARGEANNMRMFEATGAGAWLITDGPAKEFWSDGRESYDRITSIDEHQWHDRSATLRDRVLAASRTGGGDYAQEVTLTQHSYVQRIPELIELARSV